MRGSLLQRVGGAIAGTLGHDNPIVRLVRPSYERLVARTSGGKGFLVTINGVEQFYVDPKHRGWFGERYEPEVCAFLRERVTPGAVVLNVGAHVGIYAMSFAAWSGPKGRVYAFEPNPGTLAILEDQVSRNGMGGRIEIVGKAVSAAPGTAEFCAVGEAGISRLSQANPAQDAAFDTVRVAVTTIDEFCGERGIVPDWITLDIEGYEVAALQGARKTLAAEHGRIGLIVEMHPSLWPMSGTSRAALEQLLTELRLVPRSLTGQPDPLADNGVAYLEPQS